MKPPLFFNLALFKFSVDVTNKKRTTNFMGVLHFLYIGLIQLNPPRLWKTQFRDVCLGLGPMGKDSLSCGGNWQASSGFAFRGLALLLLPRESHPSPSALALYVSRNHFRNKQLFIHKERAGI